MMFCSLDEELWGGLLNEPGSYVSESLKLHLKGDHMERPEQWDPEYSLKWQWVWTHNQPPTINMSEDTVWLFKSLGYF